MYLELFVKKYKEAILINLDICMKQATKHLQAGSWEAIRSLKLDTFFANPETTESAKNAIKKIYELQTVDFAEFSWQHKQKEGYGGKFMQDLLAEIAISDATNNMADQARKSRGSSVARMLCNETLDLSIINTKEGLKTTGPGLVSRQALSDKQVPKLDADTGLECVDPRGNRADQGRSPKNRNYSPQRTPLGTSKSADLTSKAFAMGTQLQNSRVKDNDAIDNSNLELMAQLDDLIDRKGSRKHSIAAPTQKPPQARAARKYA
jgi:hypothetical protein